MNDSKDLAQNSQEIEKFKAFQRELVLSEIRSMIIRLQEAGSFQLPPEFELSKMETKTLHYIKKELRDTLRTLGGGR